MTLKVLSFDKLSDKKSSLKGDSKKRGKLFKVSALEIWKHVFLRREGIWKLWQKFLSGGMTDEQMQTVLIVFYEEIVVIFKRKLQNEK